jgi:DNA-binding MarR family transcriptional regulator
MDSYDFKGVMENINIIQKKLGLNIRDEATCCGISVAQCRLLMEIGESENITAIMLSEKTGLDTSTLSRTINSMVNNDLIIRKTSETDRRFISLTLTDKGLSFYYSSISSLNMYLKKVFKKISITKRNEIVDSISTLAKALEEEDDFICLG